MIGGKSFTLIDCVGWCHNGARSVLETVQDIERPDFSELKSKFELRFGEGHLSQNCYHQFTNRKQHFGEDFAALGSELEKLLARFAYPECTYAVRDKLACAQFISALTDSVRRILQLEGITSLRLAIERAKVISIIHGKNFGGEFSPKERNSSRGVKERG